MCSRSKPLQIMARQSAATACGPAASQWWQPSLPANGSGGMLSAGGCSQIRPKCSALGQARTAKRQPALMCSGSVGAAVCGSKWQACRPHTNASPHTWALCKWAPMCGQKASVAWRVPLWPRYRTQGCPAKWPLCIWPGCSASARATAYQPCGQCFQLSAGSCVIGKGCD